MALLRVGCDLHYTFTAPTPTVLQISVLPNDFQQIQFEKFQLSPSCEVEEAKISLEGNRAMRFMAQPGDMNISYEALVSQSCFIASIEDALETEVNDLPMSVLPYLNPSRYCESDRLDRMAEGEFGHLPRGYTRVMGICNWIYENVEYLGGSTDAHTSAFDTATQRTGVCRDFAHLGITFCRAVNIPARYVSNYAYQLWPQDFHACFEAYLSGRWYLFDPTRLATPTGYVRIGSGRDAADLAFFASFGPAILNEMLIFVEPVGEAEELSLPQWTTQPVSNLP